jgi:hypothetical protein
MAATDESAVGSQTPLGPNASGVAIRTYHDFQSQGHVDVMKRIGRFCVDVVDRVIDAAKAHYGRSGEAQADWEVRHPTLDVVRWSEVDMDRDSFVLELEESSPVPDTMAGRIQDLQELQASGGVSAEYMLRLLEDPDRWWADRLNSKEDVEFVDWIVTELLDPRRPMPEVPMDEVAAPMLIDRLRREVLASVRLRRPSTVVDRLRQAAADVAEYQQGLQQAVAPTGGQPQPQTPAPGPSGPPTPSQQ